MWMSLPEGPTPGISPSEMTKGASPEPTSEAGASTAPSTRRLLQALDRGLALLGSRGLSVPRRSLARGYARFLAAEALGLTDAEADGDPAPRERDDDVPPGHRAGQRGDRARRGHHARDANGVRYWITACRSGDDRRDVAVPGIPGRAFDRILIVRFDFRFDVEFAGSAPATAFLRAAAYRKEDNEWSLGPSHPFWSGASVDDLTILLRITARRLEMEDGSEAAVSRTDAVRPILPAIREPMTRPRRRSRERRAGEVEQRDGRG